MHWLQQIESDKEKYEQLEDEFLGKRRQVQTQMLTFMEEGVGKAMVELSNHRLRIHGRLKHNHQVSTTSIC